MLNEHKVKQLNKVKEELTARKEITFNLLSQAVVKEMELTWKTQEQQLDKHPMYEAEWKDYWSKKLVSLFLGVLLDGADSVFVFF